MPSYFPERCPEALTWPIACITLDGSSIVGFNPENGATCTINHFSSAVSTNSLALVGDAIIACAESSDAVVRIDARTGAVEVAEADCAAVTDANDILYAMRLATGVELVTARTFESFVAGDAAATNMDPWATRLGARGNDLYSAWHSSNELEHWDIAGQTSLGKVSLQGFDDWIWGVAPVDDGRILVASYEYISAFTATGELLFTTSFDHSFANGLRCFTN